MVSSRKRGRQEMEAVEVHKEPSLLERIRNMWEFANLVQYIYTFGAAVKIDENLDVEDLEMECLKSHSTILPEIGLALLKFVSSHRGLTPEIFDEYTRRQYVAKAPEHNPFGVQEEPAKFNDFDIFTKIRVLQQLSIWTFGNPDRIREKMTEQKDSEQTLWRIEPFGWDAEDRTYIVLDDNRLYRRTDPPPPAATPKKNSKKAKAALRASKRRRVSAAVESDADPVDDQGAKDQEVNIDNKDDTFGGMKWECLAVTLDDFTSFIATIEKSRDPNEKLLRKRIMDDVLPLLEKQEESRKRKAAQKQRELENLEKLATAKRSSRIAGRQEQQKQEEEAREAERKKQAELAMAKKEQEKWMKLEKERESRMQTREQRLKEREARRILHEEELANLSEDSKKIETGSGRLSERHLKAEIERKKKALEEIAEEDDWIFDCICGSYGKIDDGTHSIACDKCNIWQHSKCVGVSQAEAERDDFSFVCQTCKRRAADAERAKTHPPIKIKINRLRSSSSPMPAKQNGPVPPSKTPNANAHVVQAEAVAKLPQNGISSQQSPQKPAVTQAAPSPIKFRSVHGQSPQQRPTNTAHPGSSSHSNGTNPFQPPTVPGPAPSTHAFSSPQPHSPYILAPPAQLFAYPSANGYPPQYTQGQPQTLSKSNEAHNGYVAQSPPQAQGYQSMSPQVPTSLPMSSGSTQVMPPTPQVMNGQPQVANSMDHRRSSLNMSSPLVGVPVLTPMNKSAMPFSANGTPAPVFNPSAQSTQFSPPQRGSSPITQEVPSKTDPSQAAALPPASSGISPTKHSPPTPKSSIANGILGPVTPTVLPPVASLSPSPQLQNLSPPVKLSKPETTPQSSQSVS